MEGSSYIEQSFMDQTALSLKPFGRPGTAMWQPSFERGLDVSGADVVDAPAVLFAEYNGELTLILTITLTLALALALALTLTRFEHTTRARA